MSYRITDAVTQKIYEYDAQQLPLGAGAMGIVYLAQATNDPTQRVAVKIARGELSLKDQDSFQAEAQLSRLLEQVIPQHIAWLHSGHADWTTRPVLVMEYIPDDWQLIRQLKEHRAVFTEAHWLKILADYATILQVLHQLGYTMGGDRKGGDFYLRPGDTEAALVVLDWNRVRPVTQLDPDSQTRLRQDDLQAFGHLILTMLLGRTLRVMPEPDDENFWQTTTLSRGTRRILVKVAQRCYPGADEFLAAIRAQTAKIAEVTRTPAQVMGLCEQLQSRGDNHPEHATDCAEAVLDWVSIVAQKQLSILEDLGSYQEWAGKTLADERSELPDELRAIQAALRRGNYDTALEKASTYLKVLAAVSPQTEREERAYLRVRRWQLVAKLAAAVAAQSLNGLSEKLESLLRLTGEFDKLPRVAAASNAAQLQTLKEQWEQALQPFKAASLPTAALDLLTQELHIRYLGALAHEHPETEKAQAYYQQAAQLWQTNLEAQEAQYAKGVRAALGFLQQWQAAHLQAELTTAFLEQQMARANAAWQMVVENLETVAAQAGPTQNNVWLSVEASIRQGLNTLKQLPAKLVTHPSLEFWYRLDDVVACAAYAQQYPEWQLVLDKWRKFRLLFQQTLAPVTTALAQLIGWGAFHAAQRLAQEGFTESLAEALDLWTAAADLQVSGATAAQLQDHCQTAATAARARYDTRVALQKEFKAVQSRLVNKRGDEYWAALEPAAELLVQAQAQDCELYERPNRETEAVPRVAALLTGLRAWQARTKLETLILQVQTTTQDLADLQTFAERYPPDVVAALTQKYQGVLRQAQDLKTQYATVQQDLQHIENVITPALKLGETTVTASKQHLDQVLNELANSQANLENTQTKALDLETALTEALKRFAPLDAELTRLQKVLAPPTVAANAWLDSALGQALAAGPHLMTAISQALMAMYFQMGLRALYELDLPALRMALDLMRMLPNLPTQAPIELLAQAERQFQASHPDFELFKQAVAKWQAAKAQANRATMRSALNDLNAIPDLAALWLAWFPFEKSLTKPLSRAEAFDREAWTQLRQRPADVKDYLLALISNTDMADFDPVLARYMEAWLDKLRKHEMFEQCLNQLTMREAAEDFETLEAQAGKLYDLVRNAPPTITALFTKRINTAIKMLRQKRPLFRQTYEQKYHETLAWGLRLAKTPQDYVAQEWQDFEACLNDLQASLEAPVKIGNKILGGN